LEQGQSQAAEQLLEWGADPTIQHQNQESPLSLLTQVFPDFTEEQIYQEIKIRRARGKGGFKGYLKDLRPLAMLEEILAKDTRPGTERDRDYRYSFEVRSFCFTMS